MTSSFRRPSLGNIATDEELDPPSGFRDREGLIHKVVRYHVAPEGRWAWVKYACGNGLDSPLYDTERRRTKSPITCMACLST